MDVEGRDLGLGAPVDVGCHRRITAYPGVRDLADGHHTRRHADLEVLERAD
jgi:hypothetical protein